MERFFPDSLSKVAIDASRWIVDHGNDPETLIAGEFPAR
jgi:hypothetical protein